MRPIDWDVRILTVRGISPDSSVIGVLSLSFPFLTDVLTSQVTDLSLRKSDDPLRE